MSRKYFGTDGVRGRVGLAPITPEFVMRLGYAAGQVLRENFSVHGERPTVLIGKDTRLSGYMLESALEAGFSAAGVDVCLVGPLPTPAIAYLTRALRLQAGVVISASHNPYPDNGIKFFSAQGTKLPDATELAIEARLEEPLGCVASADLGRAKRIDDARGRYIEFCKSTFPGELDLRGMKIVVDCAHGAAYQTAPSVFHELGAEVISIGVQPNGLNINAGCGATAPAALIESVRANGADMGLALDGDADRIQMVDAEGALYDGDQLLYAIVRQRAQSGNVTGVVGTLMSNLALEHAFERMNIPFVRAAVGDRYVLEMLHARGWLYGGENSGHILTLDRHSTGDGTVAALQVLAAMRQQERGLCELLSDLHLYPQNMVNVPVSGNRRWQDSPVVVAALAEVEARMSGRGRVLLRASGTEPVLRVMVEGESAEDVRNEAQGLAELVRNALGGAV
ncbi:MAG: phosphoglucosamine mutase [Azonexus sp.]|nr:phosphoglucosamine mutase [Azonexus sp.]MCK6411124.1 phosphoglucosamine mutase [Azonexus sp.]